MSHLNYNNSLQTGLSSSYLPPFLICPLYCTSQAIHSQHIITGVGVQGYCLHFSDEKKKALKVKSRVQVITLEGRLDGVTPLV